MCMANNRKAMAANTEAMRGIHKAQLVEDWKQGETRTAKARGMSAYNKMAARQQMVALAELAEK